MRIALSLAVIAACLSVSSGFVPAFGGRGHAVTARVYSTVEANVAEPALADDKEPVAVKDFGQAVVRESPVIGLTSEEIKARMETQLERLRQKDATSAMRPEDLQIVYEDDHIVVVNKPAKVLTVSKEFPNLACAVFAAVDTELTDGDHMIVHRLGMDTSGLIVLAKTKEAVRGMNTVFRTRAIERHYEALVCGHVDKEQGLINLPIMRDYEFPPYVRISTEEHQAALLDLDPEIVGKKILEQPKESITRYQVVGREEFAGEPVTRVTLSSISGRYHQLNVHMAAFGHPIVGDTVYGMGGDAARNGGLTDAQLPENPNRASLQVQQAIANPATVACVHAKSLKFRHPITGEELALTAETPF